jgi:hypothetical protein
MNSPYQLKTITHLSATAIRDYMSCEARGAYARNFVDVPKVAKPVSMQVGIMYHTLLERYASLLWKKSRESSERRILKDEHKGYVRYGFVLMQKMLKGEIGPRGPGAAPEQFTWPFATRRSAMNEQEYEAKVESEIGRYSAMTSLLLEAQRQQFTVPPHFTDFRPEFNIGKPVAALRNTANHWHFPVAGSMDLLEIYPDGYGIGDYKSGWIVQKYKDRINLIEDLQMTLYSYAMEMIIGRPPSKLFIQPVEFSAAFLDEHGPETLRKLRIELPLRQDPSYYRDLMMLAQDIQELVYRIVRPSHYTEADQQTWAPRSSFGLRAGFDQSVKEGRFKPRVGAWCKTCQYSTLCSKDHPADWEQDKFLNHEVETTSPQLPIQPLVEVTTEPPAQLGLFEEPKRTAVYVKKANKQIRAEMLQSNQFVTKAKVVPVLNKIVKQMKDQGDCQCTRLDLFPLWVLPVLSELLDQHNALTMHTVCTTCPYEDCLRKKTAES